MFLISCRADCEMRNRCLLQPWLFGTDLCSYRHAHILIWRTVSGHCCSMYFVVQSCKPAGLCLIVLV